MKAKAAPPSLNDLIPLKRSLETEAASETPAEIAPSETARYIADLTAELAYLARKARLDLLAYLLDMARLEAVRSVQANRRKA